MKSKQKKFHVKKGDTVEVIAGRDKGKRGTVLRILKSEGRVVVEKLNMIKRHTKPTQAGQQGGIIEKEGKMHISNVMPVDPKTTRPSRVQRKRLEDGRRVRVTQKGGEILDTV
ncbi:MAG: 50S ribosomal protein L24 [bacterium]|nr:50S ribosomal protein L24 [bacterium]